jgi:hypothetical protein
MLNRIIIFVTLCGVIGLAGCKDDAESSPQEPGAGTAAAESAPSSPAKVAKPLAPTASKTAASAHKKENKVAKRPLKTVKASAAKPSKKAPKKAATSARVGRNMPTKPTSTALSTRPTIRPRIGASEAPDRATRGNTERTSRRVPSSAKRGPATARPNAELLLRLSDLREILTVRKSLDVHSLSGLPETDDYDGIYWGSPDGKTYIAGVQIWRPRSPIEAQRRYNDMVRSYPNAQESSAITNKTFLAHWNDFIYLAYLIPGKRTVISLTCHRNACKNPTMLVQLGTRIKERL